AVQKGGAQLSFTVNGTDSTGRRFSITHADRYASPFDISFDSSFDVGDLVYVLSQMRGVHITSVTANNALDDNSDIPTIARVEHRRAGQWVKVPDRAPVFARPGRSTVLRMVLTSPGDATTYKTATLTVPSGLRSGSGQVTLIGGNDLYTDFYSLQSVPQAMR